MLCGISYNVDVIFLRVFSIRLNQSYIMSILKNIHVLLGSVPCTEGEVRLLGGPDKFSGMLTVCVNGTFSLVCVNHFDYQDANVICRQAGFVNRGIF